MLRTFGLADSLMNFCEMIYFSEVFVFLKSDMSFLTTECLRELFIHFIDIFIFFISELIDILHIFTYRSSSSG